MSAERLARDVHRQLLMRIASAAAVLVVAFGILAWHSGNERMVDDVAEIARIQLQRFNYEVEALLEADPLDSDALNAHLQWFSARGGDGTVQRRDGQFVAVRMYDREGRELRSSRARTRRNRLRKGAGC